MTTATFILKNALRNKRRATLSILSVAVSLFLLVTLQVALREMTVPPEDIGAALRVVVRSKVSIANRLPARQRAVIERIPGVEVVSPFSWFGGKFRDEENMTFAELRRYIDRVERSGGRVQKYLVDLHFKLSFPFAGTIFVLIGVALSSGKRKPSIATGFGLTLVVAFVYYAVLRVGQTLGHNGVLAPPLAAQLGNLIFLAIGVAMLRRANR